MKMRNRLAERIKVFVIILLLPTMSYAAELYELNQTQFIIKTGSNLILLSVENEQVTTKTLKKLTGSDVPIPPDDPQPKTISQQVRRIVVGIDDPNKVDTAKGLTKIYEEMEKLSKDTKSAAQLKKAHDLLVSSVLGVAGLTNRWKPFTEYVNQVSNEVIARTNNSIPDLLDVYKQVQIGLSEGAWTAKTLERIK